MTTEKFSVEFSIKGFGKEHTFSGQYADNVSWKEILDDVVKTLESSYGFSFNMDGDTGMYYPGKVDANE